MANILRISMISAALAAAAFAGGCGGREEPVAGLPEDFGNRLWSPQEIPAAHIIRRDYRMREGDFLEIIYHVRHQRIEAYRIKIEDIIVIRFPFNSSLNQTEQVQSDGTLHLDLVGPVRVIDKTIDEVREELAKMYAKYIKDPVITVSFKQSNVKIAELKQAITTSPRGQSRLVPITPDGTISLPFIIDIKAAGLTVGELHRALNESYKEIGLEELEVTVNLQSVSPLRVYVMGEVRNAGVLQSRSGTDSHLMSLTLLQALSQAGGWIPGRAELSRVAVIRRANLPSPQAAVVNVFQLLANSAKAADGRVAPDTAKHRFDMFLEDGDIVYVPTSDIAKRADYIEYVWTRGIRAVGGFTSNYTAADTVDWLGPN